MTGSTLRLSAEEVLHALAGVDLLDVVAEGLTAPAGGEIRDSRFVVADGGATTGVEDESTRETCLMPSASLRLIRAAGLAALAARLLHAPGVVTAAVVGPDAAAQLHLAVIARCVPHLSHVAVGTGDRDTAIDRSVLDALDLAGIGLATVAGLRQAAFGATLLVIAGHGRDRLPAGHLTAGVLLVNAAGHDLPDELVDCVDQVFVDDLRLLADNGHRSVVRTHLAGPRPDPPPPHREGWHRQPSRWRQRGQIEGDLGQVLTGAHHGRAHIDDVLLVELLGESAMDANLAARLHRSAVARGLGCRTGTGDLDARPGPHPARPPIDGAEAR